MAYFRNSRNKAINNNLINKIDKSTEHMKRIVGYDGKISLDLYLEEKEKKIAELKEEISFLKKIKIPLRIYKQNDGKNLRFFSDDYSLATNFTIEKRNCPCNEGYGSSPDGAAHISKFALYPQFYFNLKNGKKSIQIFIQHEGFNGDDEVIFKRIKDVNGWGSWAEATKKTVEYFDVQKMSSYFERKGIKKEVINELEKKIAELEKY